MTGKTTATITAVDAVSVKSTSDIASLTGGTGVTVNAIVGPAIVTGATTTDVTGTKQVRLTSTADTVQVDGQRGVSIYCRQLVL
jgi:hypothetical protein